MIRTDELVRLPHATMYFNRIILTREEYSTLYLMGFAPKSWLETVVINYSEFADISKIKKLTNANAYGYLLDIHSDDIDGVIESLMSFSRGELDLLDLSVMYGLYYKKCRTFFKDILSETDIDVDKLWSMQKKHRQRKTSQALYGVDHTSKAEDVKAKRDATNIERYGHENPMHNEDVKSRQKASVKSKYGVDYTFQLSEKK